MGVKGMKTKGHKPKMMGSLFHRVITLAVILGIICMPNPLSVDVVEA